MHHVELRGPADVDDEVRAWLAEAYAAAGVQARRMERVTGIGGLFVAAQDPDGLARWYADHLGVDPVPESYGEASWHQDAGPTVVAPMPAATPHLRGRAWAVNFRVRDLDAMVAQLRAAGVPVEVDAETYPNGRFADLVDPEGNPVQLWQPAGVDAVDGP